VKREAIVNLSAGFFRFSDLLMRQYQTDYYAGVPYGERSIALALKYEEAQYGCPTENRYHWPAPVWEVCRAGQSRQYDY
jgi:hypothetical protein